MSIYDSIGGAPAIRAAVDDFYARLLADRQLAAFFTGTDLRRLKAHQRAYIAAAVGGPEVFAGREMAAAHAGLVSETVTSTLLLDTSSHTNRTGRAREHDRADRRGIGAASRRHRDRATCRPGRLGSPAAGPGVCPRSRSRSTTREPVTFAGWWRRPEAAESAGPRRRGRLDRAQADGSGERGAMVGRGGNGDGDAAAWRLDVVHDGHGAVRSRGHHRKAVRQGLA
jgi:hypothetical protein